MISYCSEDHRIQDLECHKEICSVLVSLISEDEDWNTKRYTTKRWLEEQYKFLHKVDTLLTYPIKPHEIQMIMFAERCYICYRRKTSLKCPNCITINFCTDHEQSISLHLQYDCYQIATSVTLDIVFLEEATWQSICLKFPTFPCQDKPCFDMYSFCSNYYRSITWFERSETNYLAVTDYVSDPLTLLYGVKTTRVYLLETISKGVFIIHIIGANYVDRRNYSAWEIFLHMLGNNVKLEIIMIGPELQEEAFGANLCSRCRITEKQLYISTYPLLYHVYVSSFKYKHPHVIIGSQVHIDDGCAKTWADTIKILQSQECPLFLSANSIYKAQINIKAIQRILGIPVTPTHKFQNHFCSERPYRNYESSGISYRNKTLIFYKNLNYPSV